MSLPFHLPSALKKVPLSGGASPYRPLWGVPPPPGGLKQYTLMLCCGCSSEIMLSISPCWKSRWIIYCSCTVVPYFSSGIVERAKRERAWKSPHARKGDTHTLDRRVSPFLAWGDFHVRSRFACSTITGEEWGTTRSLAHWALEEWALEFGKSHWCPDMLARHFFFLKNNFGSDFLQGMFLCEQSYGVPFSRLQNLIAPC